jgi:hypothetical protein
MTPAQNLNANPTPTSTFGQDMMDILNRLALEGENFAIEVKNEVRDYLLTSFVVLRLFIVANVVSILVYRTIADLNADPASGIILETPLVMATWYIALFVVLLSVIVYGWVCGRLGVMTALIGLIEQIAIAAGRFLSFLVPNRIVAWLIDLPAFQAALNNRAKEKKLWRAAQESLLFYLNVIAWISSISYVFLRWPFAIGFIATVLSFIGIGALIAMTYGWKAQPYWLKKVRTALFYFVGIGTTFDLVGRPILKAVFRYELDKVMRVLSDHRMLIALLLLLTALLIFALVKRPATVLTILIIGAVLYGIIFVVSNVWAMMPAVHEAVDHNTQGQIEYRESLLHKSYDERLKIHARHEGLNPDVTTSVVSQPVSEVREVPPPTVNQPEVVVTEKSSSIILVDEQAYCTHPDSPDVYVFKNGRLRKVSNPWDYEYILVLPQGVPAEVFAAEPIKE